MPVQNSATVEPELPNPFTDEYVREQVKLYGLDSYSKGGVLVRTETSFGSAHPDYLNKWFSTGDLSVPVFYIDGRVWMSLARMEVQSQAVPIALAEGKVVLLGLGMGFCCLKIMAKPDVEEVLVYELDARVIKFFQECFQARPGFEKVRFIQGDAREKFQGEHCTFCYSDIYPLLFGDGIETDPELFTTRNDIETYVYWGFERIIWEALEQELIQPTHMPLLLRWFFSAWMKTPACSRDQSIMLSNLPFDGQLKSDFVVQMVNAIKLEGFDFKPGR